MIANPKLIVSNWVITWVLDETKQIQPNGIDITVKKIFKLVVPSSWYCTLSEDERILPIKEEIFPDEDWFFTLVPNEVYDVLFNEEVFLPIHLSWTIIQRSTLNRSWAFFSTWVYDSWYEWGIGAILRPSLPMKIKLNSRLAQFVCTYSDWASLYNWIYNQKRGEK